MKLGLGTAQLGMPYGIANSIGQPSKDEALRIIHQAVSNDVTLLDTAPGYGESEQIIGEYIKKVPTFKDARPFEIVTKIPKIDEMKNYSSLEIERYLEEILRCSKENLLVDVIDCCLLHSPMNMVSHQQKVIHFLKKLKREGIVRKIGVSVYNPEDVIQFMEFDELDIIQIPINIFDLRLINSGLLKQLKLHGIEIHARSIYLQGLLLMSEERLPSYLEEARQYTSKLQELSGKCGLTSSQLALLFVRDISEIDRVIIGCESTDQLEDNVNSFGLPKLEESLFLEILDTFKEISDDIVNPTKWRR